MDSLLKVHVSSLQGAAFGTLSIQFTKQLLGLTLVLLEVSPLLVEWKHRLNINIQILNAVISISIVYCFSDLWISLPLKNLCRFLDKNIFLFIAS